MDYAELKIFFSTMGRLHLYRNISITFIVFAAMILCAVFLLFYSQATVIITPDSQLVNLNFITEIRTSSTPDEIAKADAVGGSVAAVTQQVEAVFNTSSTRPAGASNLVGRVRIRNNYSKSQKLVKTTQLQAENGVIVRTNSDVDVPAGGSVEVDVFPKDPAAWQKIESGKLVIVKLWPQLQSLVFGEVISPLDKATGGDVRYIADSDVNFAKKQLIAQAVAAVASSTPSSNVGLKGDLVSYSIDKKLGDQADVFVMKASIQVKIYKADDAQLASLIQRKAQKTDLKGLAASSIDMSAVKLTVLDASNPESIAIKVAYPLQATLTQASDILAKRNFTGKTADEIKAYATQVGGIKNIEVIISPYWRDQAPQDEKSIKIILR